MNEVVLKGVITNIEHSHTIDGVDFDRAKLVCKRDNGNEDVINLRFKSFSNVYKDGDTVLLKGNVRSYSYKEKDGKNKVVIYVFTYFDDPDTEYNNKVILDGRICKMNDIRKTRSGRYNLHFILANNLTSGDNSKRLNSYIPCIAWDDDAKKLAELSVNTKLVMSGNLHSREHTKRYEDGTSEIRVAHEFLVGTFEVAE